MSKNKDRFQPKWFAIELDSDRVYFNYKRAPYLRSKWPLLILVTLEMGILSAELILNHTAYLQLLMLFLILYYWYKVFKHKEDLDKATESRIVEELLAAHIPGDGKATVMAKEYFIVSPKEAYLKDIRCMLVVLSNGKVYRYGVELAEKNGFVLDKRASICEDEKLLELVKKYTDSLREEDKSLRVKKNASIAAACVLAFGFVIIGLALWLVGTTKWMKVIGWIVFAVFILSLILMLSLSSYAEKKGFAGTVYRVSLWVFSGLWLLVQLVFPTLLLMGGFMFIIFFPVALIFLILHAVSAFVAINMQTMLFVSLSAGVIIAAYYPKHLFGLFSRALTANGHRYEKYLQEMVEYVYQTSNIKFVVFLLYVLYLAISTVYQLQTGGKPLLGNGWDLAVLGSFLVFIAFSNMKKSREKATFDFAELFRMMMGIWTAHDDVNEDDDESSR